MYELIQVTETNYYIQSPAKIGLVRTKGDQVILIDSGNDRDAGKRVKRLLDARGWTLHAILNTHSHADHIGGNQYLQKQTGCKVYAPDMELEFTEHPVLEPSFLYGANPPGQLRHKFLMAQGCDVLPLTESCLPEGMKMIPLPGHSWNMVGFRTEDGIVYLADCLSSKETLEKYQISFLFDVAEYLSTLETIQKIDGKLFIPSHADPTEDIAPLAKANIDKVYEVAETIQGICREPVSFEMILKQLFERYRLMMTFEQHALVGSTLRSYLSWLSDTGRLKMMIEDNVLLWKACND